MTSDRHVPTQLSVLCEVDRSHAAGAKKRFDSIHAKLRETDFEAVHII